MQFLWLRGAHRRAPSGRWQAVRATGRGQAGRSPVRHRPAPAVPGAAEESARPARPRAGHAGRCAAAVPGARSTRHRGVVHLRPMRRLPQPTQGHRHHQPARSMPRPAGCDPGIAGQHTDRVKHAPAQPECRDAPPHPARCGPGEDVLVHVRLRAQSARPRSSSLTLVLLRVLASTCLTITAQYSECEPSLDGSCPDTTTLYGGT